MTKDKHRACVRRTFRYVIKFDDAEFLVALLSENSWYKTDKKTSTHTQKHL